MYDDVTYVYDDVTYVYDDVTYVYDDVTYVYDDADLQWLSAFPNEAEILFPPLTYMQPNGKTQVIAIECVL